MVSVYDLCIFYVNGQILIFVFFLYCLLGRKCPYCNLCLGGGGGGSGRWLSWFTSGVRQLHAKHYKKRYYNNSHFGDFQKLIDLHMYNVVCFTRLPYHITYWKEGLNVILTVMNGLYRFSS